MLDIVSISSAFTGLSAATDLVKGLYGMKNDTEVTLATNDIVKKVNEGQRVISELRDDLFESKDKIRFLEDEIRNHDSWDQEISKYELIQSAGGAFVYKFKSEPLHYICPNCASNRKHKIILQGYQGNEGSSRCSGCKGYFQINKKVVPSIDIPSCGWG